MAFKWLIPDAAEEDVPAAKALLVDHMEGRVKIAVPALLYYEVANILLFGRSRPPADEAAEALSDLFSIPLAVVAPAPDAADAALRLASQHGLSYYDASYVALADGDGLPSDHGRPAARPPHSRRRTRAVAYRVTGDQVPAVEHRLPPEPLRDAAEEVARLRAAEVMHSALVMAKPLCLSRDSTGASRVTTLSVARL